MSVPAPYAYPPPFPPATPGHRPPRTNAVRIHAIVALSVIGSVGTLGAMLAFFVGIFSGEGCHHEPGRDFACQAWVPAVLTLGSMPAVLGGIALCVVGLVRSRSGGGHLPMLAAWILWGGFCAAWWLIVLQIH